MDNKIESIRAESLPNIHPTAVISPEAQIHPSVVIGPYVIITGRVVIDADTIIDAHAHITGPTTIGKGNHIYSFASVGCDTQDKKKSAIETSLVIGDYNHIREYTTLSRGAVTKIGSHNLFMAYVHVAHDCIIGDHNTLANNASLAGHAELGDHIGLGGFTAVHQYTRIGSFAFAGGCSVITKDVPPYMLVSGHPAKLIGLNIEGLKRNNFTEDQKKSLKRLYKALFRDSTEILKDAEVLSTASTPLSSESKFLVDFILTSLRGLTR